MKIDHFEVGDLYSIRYEFDEGEELPTHFHQGETADQAHNVVVLEGTIAFESISQRFVIPAGNILYPDNEEPHRIVALTHAVTVHFMLHGKPASFAHLTEAEKHAQTDRRPG